MTLRPLTSREYLVNLTALAVALPVYRRRESWSAEHVREWQLSRVRRLVEHAMCRVPLYAEKYRAAGLEPGDLRTWEDFGRLPTVTRAELVDAYPRGSVASDVSLSGCLISTSSGSSGRMMEIPHRADRLWPYVLATERIFRWAAGRYPPGWRQAYVYTSPYPVRSIPGLFPLTFIPTQADPRPMLDALEGCRPQLVAVYASVLRDLVASFPEQMRALGLRAVSVNSELSTRHERDAWGEVLGCAVCDDYSSEELTRIAAECEQGRYHLLGDVCLTEILREETDAPATAVGEVVGTELHNTAMPFIRYRQGDLARMEDGPCGCGRRGRLLADLVGRSNDGFVLEGGRRLTPGFLLDACYRTVMRHPGWVAAYRLVQTAGCHAELQVLPGEAWIDACTAPIAETLVRELGHALAVSVRRVASLPREEAAKRRTIIGLDGQKPRAAK
jgi:phenylacetate-CoA ligase